MSVKVNYAIACWTGTRARQDSRYRKDRSYYMRKHLEHVGQREHDLDQITIILARGGDAQGDAYILSLDGSSVGGTPVVVLSRENVGYSYGSWNHCFEVFETSFTHYILVEDDYVPMLDRFDRELVRIADKKGTYVCSMATQGGRHAAISNGVIPSSVWKKVHPAPYVAGTAIEAGNRSQSAWSLHFFQQGFPVQDVLEEYSSPFWAFGSQLKVYGDPSLPPIFAPIHSLQ